MTATIDAMVENRLVWRSEPNPDYDSAMSDRFRYQATTDQLPAALGFGESEAAALANAKALAKSILKRMTAQERKTVLEPLAQLALRIPERLKRAIDERARAAGVSTTKYVLSRCLDPVEPDSKREPAPSEVFTDLLLAALVKSRQSVSSYLSVPLTLDSTLQKLTAIRVGRTAKRRGGTPDPQGGRAVLVFQSGNTFSVRHGLVGAEGLHAVESWPESDEIVLSSDSP